jgi:hypothetical protein
MTDRERYLTLDRLTRCPTDQMENFTSIDSMFQPRYSAAGLPSSAAGVWATLPCKRPARHFGFAALRAET